MSAVLVNVVLEGAIRDAGSGKDKMTNFTKIVSYAGDVVITARGKFNKRDAVRNFRK